VWLYPGGPKPLEAGGPNTLADSVLLYGAKGDGVRDDTAAIQAAINGRRNIYCPTPAAFYKTTAPIRVPSDRVIYGDGAGSHIKQVWGGVPAGWTGDYWMSRNVFYAGNIGSEVDIVDPDIYQSLYLHMTWHAMQAASKGAQEVQVDTTAFQAGDLVFLRSGELFTKPSIGPGVVPLYPPKYTQVNQVDAVVDSGLILVYPLDYDFDAGSSIATEREPYTGSDGLPTSVPRNITMRNLTIESTVNPGEGGGYCIFAPAMYSLFENLTLKTHSGAAFGANCLARSSLRNITCEMDQVVPDNLVIEIATMCDHVTLENIQVDRGCIALNESGGFITLDGFDIGHGTVGTHHKHNTLVRNGVVRSLDGNTNEWTAAFGNTDETENQTFDNITVSGLSAAVAAVIGPDTSGHVIQNCHLTGSGEANWPAVHVYATAQDWSLDDSNVIVGNVQIDT
jgi:hypothetical protein